MSVESDRYGTTERQARLLAMMRDIHPLLTEHGVEYSLSGGSVLGAVRHSGFIPWDDDIDIMVDRDNYKKILALFSSGIDMEYRLLQDIWLYRIIRKDADDPEAQKAAIDIFVMDHCPDCRAIQTIKLFMIQTLQGMLHEKLELKSFGALHKVCLIGTWILGKLCSYQFKFRLYEKISQIGNSRQSKYLSSYDDLFCNLPIRYPCDMMSSFAEYPFEDLKLPVVADFDTYLTLMYGDYMTPPKEEDRIPIHM